MRVPPRRCGLRGVACHAGVAYRQGGAGAARPRLPGAGPGPGQGVRAGWRFPRAGGGGTIGPHRGGRAMRRTTSTILALCALAALAGRADDPEPPGGAAAELKKLKGTWVVTKSLVNGEDRKERGKLTWSFDGDKLTWTGRTTKGPGTARGGVGVATATYKVKVDTKKKPHTIELTPEGKGNCQPGVFKVEKGLLYLALSVAKSGKASEDFTGTRGTVYVMTREKPKEKAKAKG